MPDKIFQTEAEVLDFLKANVGPIVKDIVEAQVKTMREANANPIVQAQAAVDAASAKASKAKVGQYLRCLAAGKSLGQAADFAKKIGADASVVKAVGESTGSAGGYLIAPEFGEFIQMLGANAVVRKLGARVIPMPKGQITLPGGATGATASWVGENAAAPSSQPTAKQISMNAKKLMVVVPVSNEMLADGNPMCDEWVQGEAERASARAEDLAFIRGNGGVNSPRGLKYRVAAANSLNLIHTGAISTPAETLSDLGRMIMALANANVPMEKCGWIFPPRSVWFLKTMLTSNSVRMFQEMDKGTLLGFPFADTTQIPINLTGGGGGTDESESYFADFMSCVIGDTGEYVAQVFEGAAYYDTGTAAVVSGLSNDQTVLVIKRRVDFTSLYDGLDIALMQQVDWGA
jgi:HK97 family phage major capsid protein